MATTTKSIIYIAPGKASFVMQDINCLSKELKVTPYFFEVKSKVLVPFLMLKLVFFLLLRPKQDYLISFGGYHSFVATLVAKWKGVRAFIILNGTDSVSIPDLKYGHLRGGVLRYCCHKSYQWASKLLPVSESLMQTTNQYINGKELPLGLLNEFTDLRTPFMIIPNGFDGAFWQTKKTKKTMSFVTVATRNRIEHKGVDLMLSLARLHPEWTFSIVGIESLDELPDNVNCLGYLPPEQLREVYANHTYYFQLSLWEGFGCALCEAMLCGCIPLVSDVNVLPKIVGDSSLVLDERDVGLLEKLVMAASESSHQGELFRDRILKNYPIELRIQELMKVLGS